MPPQYLLLPANRAFITFSLLAAFVLDLLPWGRAPGVPDFLALTLVFWNIRQPRLVGIGIAVPCPLDPAHPDRLSSVVLPAWEQRLGLEDRIVLVYSGSLSVWQVPERVASLVEEVRKRLPSVFLLLLTKDTAEAERFFGRLGGEGACRLIDCGYPEVGRHLAAADAALLLREEDPVNRVACPVKFAEYQACGLPVILTAGIGDVSDYVLRTGYGKIVRLEEPVSRQADLIAEVLRGGSLPMQRDEIRRKALDLYSRESYAGAYRQVLARLGYAAIVLEGKPAGKS